MISISYQVLKFVDKILLDKNRNIVSLLYIFALIIGFIVIVKKGVWLQYDSYDYIHGGPLRSPIYHLLLRFYGFFVGIEAKSDVVPEDYFLLPGLQAAFGFFAAFILARSFTRFFVLSKLWVFSLTIILLSPYFLPIKFANAILTEAICYPLFLLLVSCLISAFENDKAGTANLLKFLLLSVLLVLTRGQFIFLFVFFVVLLFYIFIFKRKQFQIAMLLCAFIAALFVSSALEKAYHYYKFGVYSSVPFTGVHLLTPALYVAKEEDAKIFVDPVQKAIFQQTYHKIAAKDLTLRRRDEVIKNADPNIRMPTYQRFHCCYDAILYGNLYPVLNSMEDMDIYKIDSITKKMAIKLIIANFDEWFDLLKKNVATNMGGDFYTVFWLVVMLLAGIFYINDRQNKKALLSFFMTLLMFANYTTVAIVQVVLDRYSLYTDTVQICLLLILVVTAMGYPVQNKIHNEKS